MENENTVATSRKAGFSLAEVLISSMIFMIVSVGFTAGMLAALRTNSMAADYYRGTTIAMNRLQDARNVPFADVGRLDMTNDIVDENGNVQDIRGSASFLRTTTVRFPTDMLSTVEVTVSIVLPQPFGSSGRTNLQLQTMITSAR